MWNLKWTREHWLQVLWVKPKLHSPWSFNMVFWHRNC